MAKKTRPTPSSKGVASMVPGTKGFDVAADAVLAELDRTGLTITELAERSGVSRETISYWVHGRRPLRADYLIAIVRVLKLTIG